MPEPLACAQRRLLCNQGSRNQRAASQAEDDADDQNDEQLLLRIANCDFDVGLRLQVRLNRIGLYFVAQQCLQCLPLR